MWVELNAENLESLGLSPLFGVPGVYEAAASDWQITFIHSGLMRAEFPFAWGDTAGLNVGIVDNSAQVRVLLKHLDTSTRNFVAVTWTDPDINELIYWGDFNSPDKEAKGFHIFELWEEDSI